MNLSPRQKRFIAQHVLIGALVGLSLIDEDTFVVIVTLIVVPLFIVSLTVAGILEWTVRQAHKAGKQIKSLEGRADDAWTASLASGCATTACIISLSREPLERLFGIIVPGRPVLGLVASVLILVAVPSLGWLGTWREVWLPMARPDLTNDYNPPISPSSEESKQ